MLEAVLKRIKYVKERSHPAKNWMAFIVVFFCYLVFCIFGDLHTHRCGNAIILLPSQPLLHLDTLQ